MNIEDLKRRSKENDRYAQAELSLAYFTGHGIDKDVDLGERWLTKASKDRSSIDSVFSVEKLKDHPDACFWAGNIFRGIRPFSKDDEALRYSYWIVGAEGGDARSQHELAIECGNPFTSIPQQYRGNEQSFYWHLKSLENGHPEAHRYLASRYANEEFPDTLDYEKAFYHLSQTVKNGSSNQANYLGMAYINGEGVQKDVVEGVRWLFISKCQSNRYSRLEFLEETVAKMSTDDYQEARSRAIAWIKKHGNSAKSFGNRGELVDPIERVPLEIQLDKK